MNVSPVPYVEGRVQFIEVVDHTTRTLRGRHSCPEERIDCSKVVFNTRVIFYKGSPVRL